MSCVLQIYTYIKASLIHLTIFVCCESKGDQQNTIYMYRVDNKYGILAGIVKLIY